MDTKRVKNIKEVVITFPATNNQQEIIREFCKDKIYDNGTLSVRQPITPDFILSLTLFKRDPRIYIGVFSKTDMSIQTEIKLSDEILKEALYRLELKYGWETTRIPPVANRQLISIWKDYQKSGHQGIILQL